MVCQKRFDEPKVLPVCDDDRCVAAYVRHLGNCLYEDDETRVALDMSSARFDSLQAA